MSHFLCAVAGPATLLLLAIGTPARPQPAARAVYVDHEGERLPAGAIARLGSARLRPGGQVHWLAYTPDGKTIVSAVSAPAHTKGTMQFWDAATGRLRCEVPISLGFFTSGFKFDRDGNIVYLDDEATYHVMDRRHGKELLSRKVALGKGIFPHGLPWLCIAPEASLLAIRHMTDHVVLFGLKDGKEQRRLRITGEPKRPGMIAGESVVFSPDAAVLAVAADGGLIEVFDPATGKKQGDLTVPLENVGHLVFSPDGRHLLCTGYRQERLLLRDWKGKREIVRLGAASDWTTAAFAPDGQHLALGSSTGGLAIHAVATGKEVRRLPTGTTYHGLLAFAPDGQTLATQGGGAISQWRIATGDRLQASADPMTDLTLGSFTPDGNELSAYTNRHVLFSRTTGQFVRDLAAAESAYLGEASLSADRRWLAVRRGKELLIADAQTGKEIRRLGVKGGWVGSHVFAGPRLFTFGSDRVIRVWDATTWQPTGELRDPGNSNLLAASADGRYFAAAPVGQLVAADHDVRLWDVDAGKLLHRFAPRGGAAYKLAFAPDGRQLALVTAPIYANPGGQDISIVDVRSGKEIVGFALPEGGASCLALAPNGRTLAAGDFTAGTVHLWELTTGKYRHAFHGHRKPVASLVFSGDSALLASASSEAPAFLWDIYGKHAKTPAAPWTAAEGDRLWQDLAGADALTAFEAIVRLVGNPGPAVALLRTHCDPAAPVDARRVRQWLHDLDSDEFDTRQIAYAALEQLGDRIEGALTNALRNKLGLEAKRRIETLRAKLNPAAPDPLRITRALEALEQIATPEAERLLETLAAGESSARLTRDAAAALQRVRKR